MDLSRAWSIIHNGLCEMEEFENSELQENFSKKQKKQKYFLKTKQNKTKPTVLVIRKIQLKSHWHGPPFNH